MRFTNLAATTILAFSALVIASPHPPLGAGLAADFDVDKRDAIAPGDVSIVDSGLTARDTDADVGSSQLDKRQVPVGLLIRVGREITEIVIRLVAEDVRRRQEFTQRAAARIRDELGGRYYVVVCNVAYSTTGQRVGRLTYNAIVENPVTYDVVLLSPGQYFGRDGDGGFQNWAFAPATAFRCPYDGQRAIACP